MSLLARLGTTNLQYIVTLALVPVARFVLPLIKTRRNNAIFHLSTGVIIAYGLFGWKACFGYLMSIIGFFIIPLNPTLTFVIAVIMNSSVHLYYFFNAKREWVLEVTGLTIIMFQKIVSTSFNISDGRSGGKLKRKVFETYALEKRPSALEWLAYCFTPFGSSTGPFIHFKVFEFILDQGNRAHIVDSSEDRKTVINLELRSIGAAFLTLICGRYLNFSLYSTEFYLSQIVVIRMVLVALTTLIGISRYFTVWNAVSAAYYELGVGTNSNFEKGSFTNLTLADVVKSRTCSEYLVRWNHSTHLFWKSYLFYRLYDGGYGYFLSYYSVFIASTIWHGFKPSYYLPLLGTLLAALAERRITKIWPPKPDEGWLKTALRMIWVNSQMLGATSAWWMGTYSSFVYLNGTVKWGFNIFALIVLCISFMFKCPNGSERSHSDNKEK